MSRTDIAPSRLKSGRPRNTPAKGLLWSLLMRLMESAEAVLISLSAVRLNLADSEAPGYPPYPTLTECAVTPAIGIQRVFNSIIREQNDRRVL